MNLDDWRTYLMSFPASIEETPFGPEVLVYKVANKIFCLLSWTDEPMSINLKCEPNLAVQLRDTYPEQVTAGYHMNKKHWNTVLLDGVLDDAHIKEWVQASYDLIYNTLPKAVRREMKN